MNCYVVIDTNVLVSALLTRSDDSATVQIIGKVIKGELIPVYSEEIMEEYQEVLNRRKFRFDADLVQYMLSFIMDKGIRIKPLETGEQLPDPKDLPFYETVYTVRERGTCLVTGNLKHFPQRPYIVTARQMLDIINGRKQKG